MVVENTRPMSILLWLCPSLIDLSSKIFGNPEFMVRRLYIINLKSGRRRAHLTSLYWVHTFYTWGEGVTYVYEFCRYQSCALSILSHTKAIHYQVNNSNQRYGIICVDNVALQMILIPNWFCQNVKFVLTSYLSHTVRLIIFRPKRNQLSLAKAHPFPLLFLKKYHFEFHFRVWSKLHCWRKFCWKNLIWIVWHALSCDVITLKSVEDTQNKRE